MPEETQELPDDALVIRGGDLRYHQFESNALNTALTARRAGISVRAGQASAIELLWAGRPLPHRHFRRTTAGAIRQAGFEIALTGSSSRHATIWLPSVSPAVHRRLLTTFGRLESNPLHRGSR